MNINFNNLWLTESCPLCGSVNHIFLDPLIDGHAWECWSCFAAHWLDKDRYVLTYSIDNEQADQDLMLNSSSIIYYKGQPSG